MKKNNDRAHPHPLDVHPPMPLGPTDTIFFIKFSILFLLIKLHNVYIFYFYNLSHKIKHEQIKQTIKQWNVSSEQYLLSLPHQVTIPSNTFRVFCFPLNAFSFCTYIEAYALQFRPVETCQKLIIRDPPHNFNFILRFCHRLLLTW